MKVVYINDLANIRSFGDDVDDDDMLSSYGFATDQDSTPWYKQPRPKDSVSRESQNPQGYPHTPGYSTTRWRK